jgi:hypothetical protein
VDTSITAKDLLQHKCVLYVVTMCWASEGQETVPSKMRIEHRYHFMLGVGACLTRCLAPTPSPARDNDTSQVGTFLYEPVQRSAPYKPSIEDGRQTNIQSSRELPEMAVRQDRACVYEVSCAARSATWLTHDYLVSGVVKPKMNIGSRLRLAFR